MIKHFKTHDINDETTVTVICFSLTISAVTTHHLEDNEQPVESAFTCIISNFV